MGQISIILIAGLIFLLSFEPSPEGDGMNHLLTLAVTVGVIVLPAALVYFLGSYATKASPINKNARLHQLYLLKRSIFSDLR